MNNKKIILSCLFLTALIIVLIPSVGKGVMPSGNKAELESVKQDPSVPVPVMAEDPVKINMGDPILWSDTFSPADDFEWDARKEAERATSLPFKLAGLGTKSARVVDTTGKTVMESSSTNQIYELEVSPDMKRIAVGWAMVSVFSLIQKPANTLCFPDLLGGVTC